MDGLLTNLSTNAIASSSLCPTVKLGSGAAAPTGGGTDCVSEEAETMVSVVHIVLSD